MDRKMIGRCGTYCGDCEWREQTGCAGCQESQGQMFWGQCEVAACSQEKGLEHCGSCPDKPCGQLRAAFDHPEHGDNGERLINLENWEKGLEEYLKLTPKKAGQ